MSPGDRATTVSASTPTFPAALEVVASAVERRVDELLTAEIERWSDLGPDVSEPLGALRALVRAGGKRLRPAFCHLAFVGSGGEPSDPLALDAAAALELVHTFALVHDDVMDGSDRRRGAVSVHAQFVRRHQQSAWRGESRRFGEGLAILVGDFAAVYADRLTRGMPADAVTVFDDLRVELCVGQTLDLTTAARPGADLASARRVARFKSAKYTVERPLHLGAALAGALGTLAAPLSAIGMPLGEAFQLRDDILGILGDEQRTGKPVGDDLRDGKLTPVVAIATTRTDDDGRALLRSLDTTSADDSIAQGADLVVATGAVDAIEQEIDRLVRVAREAIDAAPLRSDARHVLHELACYVAWRDR